MGAYSFTQCDTYTKCPRWYGYRYVKREPEAPSDALIFGSLAHDAFFKYMTHLKETRQESDLSQMPPIAKKVLDEQPAGRPVLQTTRELEFIRLCDRFAEDHVLQPGADCLFEEWARMKLADDLMRGRIDFLKFPSVEGEQTVIRDYKTSWQVPSQSEVENDLQGATYAMFVKELWPDQFGDGVRVEFDFVRYGAVPNYEADEAAVEVARDRLMSAIGKIKADKRFSPRVSRFCAWCGYMGKCEAYQSLEPRAIDGFITTDEQALEAAQRIVAFDAALKKEKDALKHWVNTSGPVALPDTDVMVGFRARKVRQFNWMALKEILELNGVNPDTIAKPDMTALDRIAKAEGFADALDEAAGLVTRTTFGVHKVEKEREVDPECGF